MKIRKINLSRRLANCPRCGTESKRHSTVTRNLREIGIGQPVRMEITYSKHYCTRCCKHFSLDMSHLAIPVARYTNRVRRVAVELIQKEKLTLDAASRKLLQKYHVEVPSTTIHDWVIMDDGSTYGKYTT